MQLSSALFTAALTLVLVRVLGPGEYGTFALALSIGSFLLVVSDFGVSHSAARFIAERRGEPREVAGILGDAVALKLLASGALSLALFLAAGSIASAYDNHDLLWTLRGMAIALFAQSFFLLFTGAFAAQARNLLGLRVVFSESAAEFVASLALVLLGAGASGAAFGRAIGYTVGAVLGFAVAARALGLGGQAFVKLDRARARRIATYAGALAVVAGTYTLFAQIDTLLLSILRDERAVGLFNAPLKLIVLLAYPGLALAGGVAPRLAGREGRERGHRTYTGALRYLLIVQALFLAPVLIWAKPIADLLLGNAYGRSADVLRALAPYVFLAGVAPFVSVAVNYLGDARRRLPIAVSAVLLNLVLDLALIPPYGVVGSAVASDLSFLIYVPGHVWLASRLVDVPLRSIALTLGRCLLAAAAMAIVLALAGTDDLSVAGWLLGSAGGLLAFGTVLLATGEVGPAELRVARRRLTRRRVPPGDEHPEERLS